MSLVRADISNELLTLDDLTRLARQIDRPAETLAEVCGIIARNYKTDVCSVYLLEPDRANLVLAATVGLRQSCIGTLHMALHEGLTGLVAEQVRPLAVAEVARHPRFKYFH
ncbi:MAG: Maltodextrin phosphorylase, partial [Acidobacteriota bacterium]